MNKDAHERHAAESVRYPSSSRAVPLIVVGIQRSGTRFITNVLNQIPGVTLQGEIPDSVFRHVVGLVEKCDHVFVDRPREHRLGPKRNRKRWPRGWESTKRDFMYSVWANLAKGRRVPCDEENLYYGYKTPFHEVYFDFYNEFFDPVRPKYICCIRSFDDHFLSVKARWPHRSTMFAAARYVRSLRQIRYMKQQRTDDVILFFLDDYKRTGIEYLRTRIFAPLGLEEVEAAVQKALKGPVNTSKKLGVDRKESLNSLQKLILTLYPHPYREFRSLHEEFGTPG